MLRKSYNYQGNTSVSTDDSVADCEKIRFKKTSSKSWNPNVPFVGTQEEWWEHFHQIEQGEFMTLEELDSKMEVWWEKRCFADIFQPKAVCTAILL